MQNHVVVDGARVVQNTCDNSPSQRWFGTHYPVLPTILISNGVNAGLTITVQYGGFGNGAKLLLTRFDANRANQMFQRW